MNKNRIKRMNKTAACGLAIALTLSSNVSPCFAAAQSTQKEENIYATLKSDGTVKGIYVVNSYDLTKDMDIVDYGTYSSVKNLTSEEEIKNENGTVNVLAGQGKFYYQGNLESKDMPWNIAIEYLLDGKTITPEELGGKSGHLEIKISIKENKAVDPTFFDNYLMQVTLTLDTAICENIKADGATVANVGDEKQILYNIMAGNEKELSISTDVKDFTMSQISFKGVNSSFDISTDSIDTSAISEETDKIKEAAKNLNTGAKKIADGTDSLSTGSKKISDALKTLDGKSENLTDGSAQVLSALKTLNAELEKVTISSESLGQLVTASASINEGINGLSGGITKIDSALQYSTMNNAIWKGLAAKNAQATEANKSALKSSLNSSEMTTLIAQLPDGQMKTALTNYVTAAKTYVAIDEAYQTGLQNYLSTVRGSVDSKSGSVYLVASTKTLAANYKEFDKQIQSLEGTLSGLTGKMDTLKSSINTLMKQYAMLDKGITSYVDGVSKILEGYSELESGITSLQNGTKELKEGTKTFEQETSGIDDKVTEKMDSMIEEMTESDFETVSFVSKKNTNVEAVQFVMVTDEITKPVEEKQEVEEQSKSFWEKLKDLF